MSRKVNIVGRMLPECGELFMVLWICIPVFSFLGLVLWATYFR